MERTVRYSGRLTAVVGVGVAWVAGVTVLAAPGTALAQEHAGDVVLRVNEARLQTGALEKDGVAWGVRVFESEFGEFPELPDWTDEPGFDSEGGAFPVGMWLGFDVEGAVRVWDGAAFAQLAPERIELRKGGDAVVTPRGDARVPGFAFAQVNLGGVIHEHLGYTLLAPAAEGVYLLALTLWTDDAAIGASEVMYLVMNKGMSEAEHEAAVAWVEEVLIGGGGDGCEADRDGNGIVNASDVGAFLTAYFDDLVNGTLEADFDNNGVTNPADVGAFLTVYFEQLGECP